MTRPARLTLPNCLASSSRPPFVLMIFCAVVIALVSFLPLRGRTPRAPSHHCQVKSKLLHINCRRAMSDDDNVTSSATINADSVDFAKVTSLQWEHPENTDPITQRGRRRNERDSKRQRPAGLTRAQD